MMFRLVASLLALMSANSFSATVVQITGLNADGTECSSQLEFDDKKNIIAFSFKGTLTVKQRGRHRGTSTTQNETFKSEFVGGASDSYDYSPNILNDGFSISNERHSVHGIIRFGDYLKVKVNAKGDEIRSISFKEGTSMAYIDVLSYSGECTSK